MKRIVIAEKPSQAKDIVAAIGDSHGEVYAAKGHLLRLEEPADVKPEWKAWTNDLLIPPGGRYRYVVNDEKGNADYLRRITSALKRADEVVIATDADREGQVIGQSILEYTGFTGKVLRAIYNGQDPVSLRKAFGELRPNAEFDTLYRAGVARQQADQIFNLTATRVATVNLRGGYGGQPIGCGRVKIPVLAILCMREIAIRSFKPSDYYEVAMEVEAAGGTFVLSHAPAERIASAEHAEEIAARARVWSGPLRVSTDTVRQAAPRPMDLPRLQSAAAKLGWSAKKTLEIAQKLYDAHIITYPRAESRHLPEVMKGDVPALLSALSQIPGYRDILPSGHEPRSGGKNTFSDKALEGSSHHAVIPNLNCEGMAARVAALGADEAKLFDIIARSYIACVSPDHVYRVTSVTAEVECGGALEFRLGASETVEAGYTRARPEDRKSDRMPNLRDGTPARSRSASTSKRQTTPPARFDEGSLILEMENCWKYVADPVERERLKACRGIGTPATRDTIIDGLKDDNMIITGAKSILLVPTEAGMTLYGVLASHVPELVDIAATARMEMRLDDVVAGRAKDSDVIVETARRAAALIPKIIAAGLVVKITNGKVERPKLGKAGTVASVGGVRPGSVKRPAQKP